MNPHSYTQLIFVKGSKNILWRKDNNICCFPATNVAGKSGYPSAKS
jgi:hypothetical protein